MSIMFRKTSRSLSSNLFKTLARERRKNEISSVFRIERFSSQVTKDLHNGLGDRYSTEERNVILEKINTSTIDEMKRYKINESRLKRIFAYRDKHGSFKSVEEILLLQGMETSVLEKFCKSIITDKSASKPQRAFTAKADLLTPELDESVRSASRTYTGIWIWGHLISWAQVDADCNLLHWKCQSLEEVEQKAGLVTTIEAVAKVVSNVPVSDAYIMESDSVIPFSRMNSTVYFLQLQRQQITAAIVTILGTREKRFGGTNDHNNLINNIYMLRSRTPARMYNLLIGTEIVSAKAVVARMIADEAEQKEGGKVSICANPDIKEYYKSLDIYQREQMNWALLLTSAFMNLYLSKGPQINNLKSESPAQRNTSS